MQDDENHCSHTALTVAELMAQQIAEKGHLCQSHAVNEIRHRFGEQFLYRNRNGNPAIDKQVMKLFNAQTKESVIWVSRDFLWRKRRATDKPSRQQ